jgi:preprotein translocase subunit SecB
MENQKKKLPKISPQKYKEILKGLELESIYLKSCKCNINRENFSPNLHLLIKDSASFNKENGNIEIFHRYLLRGRKPREKQIVIRIECTYCLIFSSKGNFSEEFFEIFKELNLAINSWPFFREFIYTITSKMNIPPLTLPLFKRFV